MMIDDLVRQVILRIVKAIEFDFEDGHFVREQFFSPEEARALKAFADAPLDIRKVLVLGEGMVEIPIARRTLESDMMEDR